MGGAVLRAGEAWESVCYLGPHLAIGEIIAKDQECWDTVTAPSNSVNYITV